MNCDLCMYIARIGCYDVKAVALGQKLALTSFLFYSNVGQIQESAVACFACLYFITVLPHDVFEQTLVGDSFKCRSENVLPAIMDTACYTLVTLRKLLLRAGDIEANPGPNRTDTRSDVCIIHLNARSIKNKIDLIEAQANQFDIITVSETRLSQTDTNTSIHLTNVPPPIRRDCPNDPHGGVVIYVKNNLFCKSLYIYMYIYVTTVNWTQTNSAVYSLMLTGQTSLKVTQ